MSPKVFAFASGKGGVGKTILTANLARFYARSMDKKILLVDGDFGLSNLDIILNLKCSMTIDDFLFEGAPLDTVIVDTKKGFDLLPASSGNREISELTVDQKRRLTYSLEEVSCRYDMILIDCPPGIARDTLHLCSVSHRTVLCVTPDPTSVTDAYAFIKLMHEIYREQRFTVVMNMVSSEEEAQRVFKKLLSVTSDFLGVSLDFGGYLQWHQRIKSSVKERELFVDRSHHSTAASQLREIADSVLQVGGQSRAWNGGLKALWPLFLNLPLEMESGGVR